MLEEDLRELIKTWEEVKTDLAAVSSSFSLLG